MTRRIVPFVACLVVLSSTIAHAQDTPTFGVVVLSGGSVGLHWQLTPKFALRPELAASHDATSGSFTSDRTQGALAISALFTVKRWDAARIYVAPRVGFSAATGSSSTPWLASVSCGAQVSVHRHVAVFGEAGVQDNYSSSSGFTDNAIGTRSALGLVIFF